MRSFGAFDDRSWPTAVVQLLEITESRATGIGESCHTYPINSDTFCTIGSELFHLALQLHRLLFKLRPRVP